MDNDVETEQELREIYYNPATGYQSAERLHNKAFEEGLSVCGNAVKVEDAGYLHQVQAYSKAVTPTSDVHWLPQ